MTKGIFMKFFEYFQRHFETISYSYSFLLMTPAEPSVQLNQIFNYIKDNIVTLLDQLTEDEKFLFFHTFQKDGITLSNITDRSKDSWELAFQSLENKGLAVVKFNVSNVNLQYKLYIFDEIRDFLTKTSSFVTESDFMTKMEYLKEDPVLTYSPDIPLEILQYFYSYSFFVPKRFLLQQQSEQVIQYLYQEKFAVDRFFMIEMQDPLSQEKTIYSEICVELMNFKKTTIPLEMVNESDLKTYIFNNFLKICFVIYKKNMVFKEHSFFSKKNLDKLLKYVPSEYVLIFLLTFLKNKGYFKISTMGDSYQLDNKIFEILHENLIQTYKSFLSTDTFIQEVLDLILEETTIHFSLADLLVKYFKKNSKELLHNFFFRDLRRQIIKSVEILYCLGLLVKTFIKEGLAFYHLSPLAKSIYLPNYRLSEKKAKSIHVVSSFQLLVYPEKVNYQTNYLLNIFLEIKGFSTVYEYSLTKNSFYQALYFKFKGKDLIDLLLNESNIQEDAPIIQMIQDWEKAYKSGVISEVMLLQTTKNVLDQLMFQPEYSQYILQRLSDDAAIISKKFSEKRILDENHIYFWKDSQ